MTRKLIQVLAVSATLGGFAAATTAFAAGDAPSSPPPRAVHGMTGDHGGMMNMMQPMSSDQMTRMVESCNRVMDHMGDTPM